MKSSEGRNRLLKVLVSALVVIFFFSLLSLLQHTPTNSINNQQASFQAHSPATAPDPPQVNATKDARDIAEERAGPPAPISLTPSISNSVQPAPAIAQAQEDVFPDIPGSMPVDEGALVQVQPPFSGSQFHIENDWYLDTNGRTKRILVFAGNISGPGGEVTAQGVLIVTQMEIRTNGSQHDVVTTETSVYPTPTAGGSLRIVGAKQSQLFLATSTGKTLIFNLTARRYQN